MNFSVVIPLYNKGPHIAETIESVMTQTLQPVEIIVVDDGSTDGGLETVQAMNDPRIKLFQRTEPGPGGYAARNVGVEKATCDWIAFIDADDHWSPTHLSDLHDAVAVCDGQVGCVFSRLAKVTGSREDGYPVSTRYLQPGHAHDLETMLRAWLDMRLCPLWTGAVAFRRDVILAAGLFPAGRARRGGDKDLWLRCMAMEKTAFAPAVSAYFHQDTVNRVSNSASHAALPIICETIATLMPKASKAERVQLRALSNQEIGLYAGYAARARAAISWQFPARIYLPQGIAELGRVTAMMAASSALRLVDPKRRWI